MESNATIPRRTPPISRFTALVTFTFAVQMGALWMAPQFICACTKLHAEVVLLAAAPVAWAFAMLVIHRGQRERVLAYAALAVSLFFLNLIHPLNPRPLLHLLGW